MTYPKRIAEILTGLVLMGGFTGCGIHKTTSDQDFKTTVVAETTTQKVQQEKKKKKKNTKEADKDISTTNPVPSKTSKYEVIAKKEKTTEAKPVANRVVHQGNLNGTWKQQDGISQSYLKATIRDGRIDLNWNINGKTMHYWSGKFKAKNGAPKSNPFTAKQIPSGKTGTSSFLESQEKKKKFIYKQGKLYFNVTYQNETETVVLIPVKN